MSNDLSVLDKLKGRYAFYGVDANEFKLGTKVYEAVEDPDDGYRSYLDTVRVVKSNGIFQRNKLDTVRLVTEDQRDGFRGYRIESVKDGHVWLRVGTDYNDDYYPTFRFQYTPRPAEQLRRIARNIKRGVKAVIPPGFLGC